MYRLSSQRFLLFTATLFIVLISATTNYAQVTTGAVRGVVRDPAGNVVPNASVKITSSGTDASKTASTTGEGVFQFNDLQPGDYTVVVQAANFKALTLNDVRVQLNQPTDLTANLEVGVATETVQISAAGAELIETSTANLSKSFEARQVVELAQTGIGGAAGAGVNNLALIAPNVTSSGGVGVGVGGSVGGQRPRNNNFVVDGIDNNDKSVTGPTVYITPESVQEFSLLANQFSAEFGRSSGGQFITVTKSGTNDYHGTVYGFFQNRKLNALDQQQKIGGITRDNLPRFDQQRFGFNFSGPLYLPAFNEGGPRAIGGKDKLFFFGSYERSQVGNGGGGTLLTPTGAGLATIQSLPGISPTNFGIFRQFVPVASQQFIDPQGGPVSIQLCSVALQAGGDCPSNTFVDIPVGKVSVPANSFSNNGNYIFNVDYNQNQNTTHRFRFIANTFSPIDNSASLPQFYIINPGKNRLFSYTLTHTFSSKLTNETRLAFRRSENRTAVPNIQYSGLDQFPNITLDDLQGLNIGPDPNAPQSTEENHYQVVNNTILLLGNHTIKFGVDFRNIISPQVFVQRQRGDYEYGSTDYFLRDLAPDVFGERNVGASTFYGNQRVVFPYVQDDWKVRSNLTLNLGLNYSYQGVPDGAKLQRLNSIASVPGFIDFREPRAQKYNFGPKVGIAYSPNASSSIGKFFFGNSGESSIRAGFSQSYDYIFDNVYILASPPQAQQTIDIDVNNPNAPLPLSPNFLANGGISPNAAAGTTTDPAAARAVTGSYIPDQKVPYALTYTLSFQRQLFKNYSVELRYLGTRGVHLLTQNRINRQPQVSPQLAGLPTFYSRPSLAQLNALTLTLDQIEERPSIVPAYDAAGFNGSNLVGFLSNGNSSYNGFSTQVTRRFTNGLQFTSAYTWSHLIDDSTAEVFSTVLSPRRAQDFQNIRDERADSALDRRHRFVLSGLYELPFFRNSKGFTRALLGGFEIAGTWTLESGEKATVRSGNDSNLNGDAAGDRTIINPNGVVGTSSSVTALTNSNDQVVGYLVDNPNAQYIQAGDGAVANAGRNTLQLPGIKNVDLSLFKNFRFGNEGRFNFQLRGDFYNVFNIPQYVPGSVNSVVPVATTGVGAVNLAGDPAFNRPDLVFSSNPRVIQLAARFNF